MSKRRRKPISVEALREHATEVLDPGYPYYGTPELVREAADEIERLRGLLDFCVQHLECGLVHHDKGEYHKDGEPCPVMARLYSALPDRENDSHD